MAFGCLVAWAGCGFQATMGSDAGSQDLSGGSDGAGDAAMLPDVAVPPDLTPPLTWSTWASGQANDLFAVAGGLSDVFAVGAKGTIVHTTNQGSLWYPVNNPTGMAPLEAAWQLPGGADAYAAGESANVLHSTGGASGPFNPVTMTTAGLNLTGLWGSAPNDLYAVGFNRGSATSQFGILHSTGGTFVEVSPTVGAGTPKAYAVWGSSASDVYVVGDQGTIAHSTGDPTNWTTQQTGSGGIYYGVWGSSATDVYVVGQGGVILHSTGGASGWTPETSNTNADLRAVWGASAVDVYAVGTVGTILHTIDGGQNWKQEPAITGGAALYAIWGNSALDVYVVGQAGVVLHKP